MKRIAILFAIALFFLLPTSVAAAECQFVLGFKTLRDLIGHDIVGECLEDQRYAANGNSEQLTTGGLLVWRKADNQTAFTDGYRTWINGPNGLEQRLNTERFPWEADYAPGDGIATPTSTPTPPPSPEQVAQAEQAIAALPWVSDGLTAFFEQWTADHLRSIATESPQVFWELMQKPWMQSDSIHVNGAWLAPLFENMASMVRKDEATVIQVVRMPFMATLGFGADYTWKTLNNILKSDPEGLQQLLSHPELRSGITVVRIPSIPLLYLEQREPESAAAIRAMPWRNEEPWAVEELRRLAVASQPVFWAWMDLFADEPLDRAILESTATIARIDKDAGKQIFSMPFLKTKDKGADSHIMSQLSGLAWRDPDLFRRVLSHPKLKGGITDDHRSTLDLVILAQEYPDAAAAIEALPWVRDGVGRPPSRYLNESYSHPTEFEESMTHELVMLAKESPKSLEALLSKPWIQDGVTGQEHSVVLSLKYIDNKDTEALIRLLAMPFLETIEGQETEILQTLRMLPSDASSFQWVLSHPKLAGGIADNQRAAVSLLSLEWQDPEAAKTIWVLPWVEDGIEASETAAVLTLQQLAQDSKTVFQVLAGKPWIQDNLTAEERTLVSDLGDISASDSERGNEAAALRIINMPFLNTLEPFDAGAVKSLWILHRLEERSRLEEILSHPTFHGGIRDDQTTLVAALGVATRLSPELLYALLDPSQALVEKRTLHFPGQRDVALGVVTTSHEASGNMDWLEFAVRTQVAFMGTAFPWGYVSLWVDDKGTAGAHETGHLHAGYYEAPGIVAHEAAHLYWRFGTNWITEGGAQLMDTVTEYARVGSPIHTVFDGMCAEAKTILQLESIRYERSRRGEFGYIENCDHALGAGLFVDLYRTLGDGWFREGFRKLFLKLRAEEHHDVCRGLERNICYVTFAFVNEAHPQAAAAAAAIINRWYYGAEHGPE